MNWIRSIKQKISFTISLYKILTLIIGITGIVIISDQINQLEIDTKAAAISSMKERYDDLLSALTIDINTYMLGNDTTNCPTIFLQEDKKKCAGKVIYLYRVFNYLLDQYLMYQVGVIEQDEVIWQTWEQEICITYHSSMPLRELFESQKEKYSSVKSFIEYFGDREYCNSLLNID